MIYTIGIATEDQLSEALVEKLLASAPFEVQSKQKFRKNGFGYLKKKINAFNEIGNSYPIILLTDLDNNLCAPSLLSNWLTVEQSKGLLFRVAVKEVESWLLADREGISCFMNVSFAICPDNPDQIVDPKLELLSLAKRSKNRELKADLLPQADSTSPVGIGYNSRLSDFVWNYWDVERAIARSDSLCRAWNRICQIPSMLPELKHYTDLR